VSAAIEAAGSDDFGLHADALRERFAGYVKRYDVPAEVSDA
jgi:hypothetical protein